MGKWKKTFWILGSVLLLLPFIYLAQYAHPIADDHIYAWRGIKTPLLTNLKSDYLNWNGRYTSNILVFTSPLTCTNTWLYKLWPIILICLTPAVIYHFIDSIIKAPNWQKAAASLIISALFLNNMPLISEGIYWYTGAITYHFACLLTILYLSALCHFFQNTQRINRKLHLIFLSLLLAVIIGFNEVNMILMIAFHGLSLLYLRNHNIFKSLLLLFTIAVVCGLVMFFAPGNSTREAYFPDNHNIINTLWMSSLQVARFSVLWSVSIGTILVWGGYMAILPHISFKFKLPKISLHLAVLLWLLIIFICVFPAYWSTGILGQHRTVNVACFFFMLASFFVLKLWWEKHKDRFMRISWNRIINKNIRISIIVGAYILIMFSGNQLNALQDISSGEAYRFHVQMTKRENLLNTCEENDVLIHTILERPKTLFIYPIDSDQTNLVNIGYARYYGKSRIIGDLSKEKSN